MNAVGYTTLDFATQVITTELLPHGQPRSSGHGDRLMGYDCQKIIEKLVGDCTKTREDLADQGSFRLRVLLDMILIEASQELKGTARTSPIGRPGRPSQSSRGSTDTE